MHTSEASKFETVELLYGVQERCIIEPTGERVKAKTKLFVAAEHARLRKGYILSHPNQQLGSRETLEQLLKGIPKDATVFFDSAEVAGPTDALEDLANTSGCFIEQIDQTSLRALYRKKVAQIFVTHGHVDSWKSKHWRNAYEYQLAQLRAIAHDAKCQLVSDLEWIDVYYQARLSRATEDHFLRHAIRQSVGVLILDNSLNDSSSTDENIERCKNLPTTMPLKLVVHGPQMNYRVPYTHFDIYGFDTFQLDTDNDWQELTRRMSTAATETRLK